jgi:hypothetical protein
MRIRDQYRDCLGATVSREDTGPLAGIRSCPYSLGIETLTIDMTTARDFADSRRPRHGLAVALLELHRAGDIELAMAPQGTRLDISGELARLITRALAEQHVAMLPQLAYLSPATFPSSTLFPGFVVKGFGDAWQAVLDSWRIHESRPADHVGSPDRFHVETHVIMRRRIFVTDDRPLQVMCRRLREEHGFAIVAMGLGDYLDHRSNSRAA